MSHEAVDIFELKKTEFSVALYIYWSCLVVAGHHCKVGLFQHGIWVLINGMNHRKPLQTAKYCTRPSFTQIINSTSLCVFLRCVSFEERLDCSCFKLCVSSWTLKWSSYLPALSSLLLPPSLCWGCLCSLSTRHHSSGMSASEWSSVLPSRSVNPPFRCTGRGKKTGLAMMFSWT